jgi:tetratricopeptide (TPR) repeat protein
MRKPIQERQDSGRILNQAACFIKNAQYQEAIVTLEQGLTVDPNNKPMWESIFACNLELKRPDKAIEALDHIWKPCIEAFVLTPEMVVIGFYWPQLS